MLLAEDVPHVYAGGGLELGFAVAFAVSRFFSFTFVLGGHGHWLGGWEAVERGIQIIENWDFEYSEELPSKCANKVALVGSGDVGAGQDLGVLV